MGTETRKALPAFLDPIDRVSEVLFGLIMVLTSTGTLSVLTAGQTEVRTMILGALGCNLAWGVIDAGMYLMGCVEAHARGTIVLRAVQQAASVDIARRAITESLPGPVADALAHEQVEAIRQHLKQLPLGPNGRA